MGADEKRAVLSTRTQVRKLHDRTAENACLAVFYELLEQSADLLGNRWYAACRKAATLLRVTKFRRVIRPPKYPLRFHSVDIWAEVTKIC